ncbi:MAG: ABC transporter substrate-binding protein, partial [Alphaproteobacteria bacterium]|nr:ABC transporter substrate-binding protein [Alphaproteobacteria bacterium]
MIKLRQVSFAAAFAAFALPAAAAPFECPARGGDLVMGISAQLPGIDPMFFPALITNQVARNMFEHLITRDENLNPVLDLAEAVEESPDKLSYTFKLRPGVKFHNGKTMTARDVAASFSRFKKLATNAALAPAEGWEAKDDLTFVVRLKAPAPMFLDGLSAVGALVVIMPEETPDLPNGERFRPVGTGPFEFVEWVPDSHVKLRRFAGYVANPKFEQRNGFSGRKVACVDTVTFKVVPEPAARIAGLERGDLDLVDDLPFKEAQVLKGNRNVALAPVKNWWNHHVQTNLQMAPTNNIAFRRAVQAALDMREIMEFSTDGAYSIHPGWLFPGQEYYTDIGKELYNQKNAARARQLLQEAGYRGEEVIIATNTTYPSHHAAAQVMAEQMKAVGINVKLSVTDWAAQLRR